MRLRRLHVRHFRNHQDTSLELGDGGNIIVGDNGQGKTSILEAISYLCLTKSFYAGSDAVVLGFSSDSFEVEGVMVSDRGVESTLRVAYVLESREKAYVLNKHRVEPFSSVVGRFPVVILSPEHSPITLGPPAERRKFVDLVISQASMAYFQNILEYRDILKQRNRVLLDAKRGHGSADTQLEPWDRQIADVGAKVVCQRREFVDEFQPYIASAYCHITDDAENPRVTYVPSAGAGRAPDDERAVSDHLYRALLERRREEIGFGTTIVGPHRDEFALTINDLDLRRYASQGQHKTFLIALKAGEFHYLKERRNETPIVLLDDVFSELDERRAKRVLHFVGELSQTLVTSTSHGIFDDAMTFGDRNRKFFVVNGTVVYPEGMPSA